MADKKAVRIQTSVLNAAEKKVLVWLADRQPSWVVSDTMTVIGILGAVMIAAGFILCASNVHWLWLAIAGFFVNWYGDSLDGTLARVRNTQRPVYGYYLDHTVDCINEMIMFVGVGLSPFMRLDLSLALLVLYLCLTVNVSMNAHLKSEFQLTYFKLGPTEFRIVACILILLLIFIAPLREYHTSVGIFGEEIAMGCLDIAGIVILAVLVVIYITTVCKDARSYAKMDPLPKKKEE